MSRSQIHLRNALSETVTFSGGNAWSSIFNPLRKASSVPRDRSRSPAGSVARRSQKNGIPPTHRCIAQPARSEEHTSELQSPDHLVCRLLLEKKKSDDTRTITCRTTNSRI